MVYGASKDNSSADSLKGLQSYFLIVLLSGYT